MKTELNKFGWFMSGCYVTSFLTAIVLDVTFEVPLWTYFVLIIGFALTVFLERKEVLNGIARYIKQRR